MVIISVKVKTKAREQSLQIINGEIQAHLASEPVEGKANQELIKLLSKKLAIPSTKFSISVGASSRNKLVKIDCLLSKEEIQDLLKVA